MPGLNPLIIIVISSLGTFFIGYFLRKYVAEAKIGSAEQEAKRLVEDAQKASEAKKRETLLEAKEEAHRMRHDMEKESRERRIELQKIEKRLLQREETLDRKLENLDKKEENLRKIEARLEDDKLEVQKLQQAQVAELERISQLSQEEARLILLDNVRKEVTQETAQMIRVLEAEAKETADKKAKEVISAAIQRCAADHVSESTVSVVELPNDEMKGRIIGREGRNIRTFESLTGVDLIIDDTPEAVVISAFDPIRREKARIALEKLVSDGRIHPARIEEMYAKAQQEVETRIREEGERAAYETGVHGLHPELIKLLGHLHFRTSYGQNVLKHSIEVSMLAAMMAAELDIDVNVARRAGLLHDIGKAVDHEVEGTHITIGMELLKKYRESQTIIDAMCAHHGDFEPNSIEAVLITAADALSAARPGARRETLESYIRRLQKLEEIADAFEGVEKSYAIQAGREVRIMVKPDRVNDDEAYLLGREIVKQIEEQLEYPGQIKVTVIRETRVVDYAK